MSFGILLLLLSFLCLVAPPLSIFETDCRTIVDALSSHNSSHNELGVSLLNLKVSCPLITTML
jgi:hypothetical protein